MTSIDKDVRYAPIPTNPIDPNVVVLTVVQPPPPFRRTRLRLCLCLFSAVVTLLLLAAAVFFLYPSDPEIQLVRIKINHIQVDASNKLLLNLSFSLTIKVRNKAFLWLQYDSLVVSIGYRGRELGFVSSDGGRVKARGSSFVNATLDLNGLEIIHDVIYFLEDLAKGVIPFDTDTKVRGNLGLLFFKIPLEARVICEVYVDVSDQTVSRQNCSSEILLVLLFEGVVMDSELKTEGLLVQSRFNRPSVLMRPNGDSHFLEKHDFTLHYVSVAEFFSIHESDRKTKRFSKWLDDLKQKKQGTLSQTQP